MLLLVDLDGVVYRGREPVPGVAALLAERASRGDAIAYVSNGSMTYRAEYVPRLAALGAPVALDRVITAARASALYLRRAIPARGRVLVVGLPGLAREIAEVGFEPVAAAEVGQAMDAQAIDGWSAAGRPVAVLVGLDPGFDYLSLAAAADCVRAGALLIATHRDALHPTDRGLRPATGAIVAAIEAAAGSRATVTIGKPAPLLLAMAAGAVPGATLTDAVMIGDSVTDVAAGKAAGTRTVLMLTGVTSHEEAAALRSSQQPTAIAADSFGLADVLDALSAPDLPAVPS